MNDSERTIPKNLILFWHDRTCMHPVVRRAVARTISAYDQYNIVYADDAFMRAVISRYYSPDVLHLYLRNRIPASRSDIARLMLLYLFGGIYVDASYECHTVLDELISLDDELLFLRRDDFPKHRERPEAAHVTNGLLGSAIGSSFIENALQVAISNLKSGIYNFDVWRATGPQVINNLLKSHGACGLKAKFLYYTVLTRDYVIHRRNRDAPDDKKFLNTWTDQQNDGILPMSYFNMSTNQNV